MARLKSRTAHPPFSFQFLQPEAGQTVPFTGSFNHVVEQVQMLRLANPFLCERHGWRTDTAAIEAEVDGYNTARCIAGGWLDFILPDEPGQAVASYSPPVEKKRLLGAVVGVKRVAAGVALLVEWLGSGGKGVDPALAEKRASICVTCPLNGKGGLLEYFTAAAAEKIKVQLEMRSDMQMKTSFDSQMGTCTACSCHLPLKVHVPLDYILDHTSEEVKKALDPRCWVLKGT